MSRNDENSTKTYTEPGALSKKRHVLNYALVSFWILFIILFIAVMTKYGQKKICIGHS
jgi:hypothetical protein